MMEVAVVAAAVWACLLPQVVPTPAFQDLPIQAEDLLANVPTVGLRSGASTPAPCSTPEGEQGFCVSAIACQGYKPLLDHLRNETVLLFFRERVCHFSPGVVRVCCPNNPKLQSSSIFLLTSERAPQSSAGSSLRPSQRPNARQPSQPGFESDSDNEGDEEREFLSTASPKPTVRPTPQSSPQFIGFGQSPATPSTDAGVFRGPDREPNTPNPVPFNPPNSVPQNQGQSLEEPSEPKILPAEGECGAPVRSRMGSAGNTPWVVGIGVLKQEEFRVNCGGALVSRLHVISAAHCVQDATPKHVRLGDPQRVEHTEDIPVLTYTTADYNPVTRENNLALITLARPVTFTDNIQPVCLPFRYRLDGFRSQLQYVVGWSDAGTHETGQVEVLGPDMCRAAYGSPALVSNNVALFSGPSSSSSFSSTASSSPISRRSSSSVTVDRRNLCGTPIPSASARSCLSDYGAPLFFHDEETTGLHFLSGVSSLGDGCQAGPGLYTRIGAYLPWLSQQLSEVEAPTPKPVPIQPPARQTQAVGILRG